MVVVELLVGGVVLAVLAVLVRRAWVIAHREEEQSISEAQARENARAVVERDPALGSRAKRGPGREDRSMPPRSDPSGTSCVGAVTTPALRRYTPPLTFARKPTMPVPAGPAH